MKRILCLLCAVLLIACAAGCAGGNPYAAFDPEGAIAHGLIGMDEDALLKANAALEADMVGDDVVYRKVSDGGDGDSYAFLCSMEDGKVRFAQYFFRCASPQSQADDAVLKCACIKDMLGEADYDPDGIGDLTAENIDKLRTECPQSMICLSWDAPEGYHVMLIIPFLYGPDGPVNIIVIHAQ